MNNDMKLYYDYTISPLGQLFYKTLWKQLEGIKDKKILDFGSGFGFTTNFLAKNNEVVALEIDSSMIEYSKKRNNYIQINGDLEEVKKIEDESFDFITCHLVLEFVENPKEIMNELIRVLKKDGILSVVRHNKNGRIIQAIVKDYDLKDAKKLLDGGFSYSSAFGDIKYYNNDELLEYTSNKLKVEKVFGIRVLGSIQDGKIQNNKNWVEEMLEIENKLAQEEDYIKIAYFNHILLRK